MATKFGKPFIVRLDSPCHECKSRKVTADYNCHLDCPRYAEYREKLYEKSAAHFEYERPGKLIRSYKNENRILLTKKRKISQK